MGEWVGGSGGVDAGGISFLVPPYCAHLIVQPLVMKSAEQREQHKHMSLNKRQ